VALEVFHVLLAEGDKPGGQPHILVDLEAILVVGYDLVAFYVGEGGFKLVQCGG